MHLRNLSNADPGCIFISIEHNLLELMISALIISNGTAFAQVRLTGEIKRRRDLLSSRFLPHALAKEDNLTFRIQILL